MSQNSQKNTGWVDELLRVDSGHVVAAASTGFADRCRQAALAGCAMAAMEASARKQPAAGMTFGEWVGRVAFAAGVKLEAVLGFLGLSGAGAGDLDAVSPASARLAVAMGVSRRQYLVQMDLGCLAGEGMTVARPGGAEGLGEGPIAAVEEAIAGMEDQLDDEARATLRRNRQQAAALYQEFEESQV